MNKIGLNILKVAAGNGSSQFLTFIFMVLAARSLKVNEYGELANAIALILLFSQLSDLGFYQASVKRLKSNATDISFINEVLFFKLSVIFIVIILAALIIDLHVSLLVFSMCAMYVASSSLLQTFQAYFTYKEFFGLISLSLLLGSLTRLIVLVICSSITENISFYLVLIIYLLMAPVSVFVLGKYYISNNHSIAFSVWKNTVENKYFLRNAAYFFISGVATYLILRIDILMLSSLSSSYEVGLFAACLTIALSSSVLTGAVTSALLPKFVGDGGLNKDSVLKVFCATIVIFIVLNIFVSIFDDFIIYYLFGDSYLRDDNLLNILVLAHSIGLFTNPISLLIIRINSERYLALINVTQLIINVLMNFVLIPDFAGIGAALSTLFVKVFGALAIFLYLWMQRQEVVSTLR